MYGNDETIDSFLLNYYSKTKRDTPLILVTDTVANTIIDIIDSFIQLYEKKGTTDISVKEIACRAGYSRTTFYAYFRDSYDVLETTENLILSHVETYSPKYYQMYDSTDNREAIELTVIMINRYMKYLRVLLKNKDFIDRYKESMRKIFAGKISLKGMKCAVPEDYFEKALSSATVDLFIHWLQQGNHIPLPIFLDYTTKLYQGFSFGQIYPNYGGKLCYDF